MEATTNTRKRKPLADRTNTTSFLSSNPTTTHSLHKPPPPLPPPTTSNSTSTADAAPVSSKSSNQINNNNNKKKKKKKKELVGVGVSSIETRNTKRRRVGDSVTVCRSVDNDANKENIPVDDDVNWSNINFDILPDVSISSPLSPYQKLSPIAEPLTVYARRQTAKKKGKEKVVNEAFTCLPVERKRTKSNKESVAKISKCLTELPKKRRNKERVVSNDYFEQQKAYFAEIDKCELPEEEVSESELSV